MHRARASLVTCHAEATRAIFHRVAPRQASQGPQGPHTRRHFNGLINVRYCLLYLYNRSSTYHGHCQLQIKNWNSIFCSLLATTNINPIADITVTYSLKGWGITVTCSLKGWDITVTYSLKGCDIIVTCSLKGCDITVTCTLKGWGIVQRALLFIYLIIHSLV